MNNNIFLIIFEKSSLNGPSLIISLMTRILKSGTLIHLLKKKVKETSF